jgi:hypothetical protein
MPFISQLNTQTMHIESIEHNCVAMFPYEPITLAGFEPGSYVPEAEVMSIAPRCQGFFFSGLTLTESEPTSQKALHGFVSKSSISSTSINFRWTRPG